jgi:bifunctional lysine-specific demethylase and histidyl-hydroxylase NO66
VSFTRVDRSFQTDARAKPAHPDGGTASGALDALERCVGPVEAERFFDEYWEQKPLLVPRDEEGRFNDLLSVEEVEQRVTGGGLRFPAFRIVKEGEKYTLGDYAEDISWSPKPFSGTAKAERVAAEFERGATIVLQALHLHHPPLARFCRDLERELGHPAQTNAYYTPPSAQGFKVHHDTHDVFCLQVAGEKRWLVYPPVLELPLRSQKYTPELGEPGETVLDVTMRAGDSLYLPRGWLHQAMTSDTASLHMTVGVSVSTWLEAVQAALEETAKEEVDLRRSVPADGGAPDGLLELVAARLAPEAVSSRMRRRFVRTRRPVREDAFDQVRGLEELDVETPLERRATVIFDLAVDQQEATLSFEGRDLRFPARVGAELEFVAAAEEPFLLADLPGRLDDAGRLVLGRRLVREGFLRISPG